MDPRPIDVVKVGGHELDDAGFVAGLAQAVKAARDAGRDVVVVHGGGRAIAELQAKLGLTVRVVDGLRVTDEAALDVAEMALSGLANKRLVAAFVAAGLDALGLSGVDRGLLRCRKIEHPTADLGRVGEVDAVRVDVLRALLADGVLPVISPISLGPDGRSVNVNADTAAAAVAGALGADRLVFLSNVPGVRVGEGVAPRLDEPSVAAAVASGAIAGGMIPKVGAALAAVRAGVAEARIVDLAGWASGGGTAIVGVVDPVDAVGDEGDAANSASAKAPTADAVSIRPAAPADVPAIAALVAEFARRGDVLPRPPAAIRVTLGDWVVGVASGRLVACGALFRYGAGLAEVRTTIVADYYQGRGVGRQIVEGVVALAAARGIPTVFTLTRRAPFFERLGFQPADKATFPEKVWKDCRTCPLIDDCDEIALRLDLVDDQRRGDDPTRRAASVPADDGADLGTTTNMPIIHDPERADAARAPEPRSPVMVHRPTVHRVVLAYSGGLDTSVIVPWLREEYGCEVVCFCADLGQGEELEGLRDKALASGAVDCVIEDLRDVFAREFVFPMLQAGAVYERQYLLGTAIARPLIAMRQVAVAERVGADAVAHGCTGKGNDQVRFELTYQALNPTLHVIAPWREWSIRSREDALAYADAHNVPIASREKSVYSRDRNLWHISHEGGRLEDPRLEPEADMFLWTVDPRNAPDTPEDVEIGFEAGVPVTVNGEALEPAALIDHLNVLAARHGVGRVDIVENRLVGMKSRGVYETPGGTLLYAAHREVESLCLDRETAHYKEQLSGRYAELVYFGQWFHPLREGVQSFITRTQESVTGWARLRVFKGGVTVLGRYSPHSLYREDFATFGRDDVYDQTDAAGFINLFGLAMKMRAMMEVSGGGRTRYAAPDFSAFKRD